MRANTQTAIELNPALTSSRTNGGSTRFLNLRRCTLEAGTSLEARRTASWPVLSTPPQNDPTTVPASAHATSVTDRVGALLRSRSKSACDPNGQLVEQTLGEDAFVRRPLNSRYELARWQGHRQPRLGGYPFVGQHPYLISHVDYIEQFGY